MQNIYQTFEFNKVKELVLDFAKLEYVSSAGLRVILSTQKKMNKQGTMVVKNPCDDIKEVFDITGFADTPTALLAKIS